MGFRVEGFIELTFFSFGVSHNLLQPDLLCKFMMLETQSCNPFWSTWFGPYVYVAQVQQGVDPV